MSRVLQVVFVAALGFGLYKGFAGKPVWWGKDTTVTIATADPKLKDAKARAVATVDDFLQVALSQKPGTSKHAVKIPITDGQNTEVFWVNHITRQPDGRFSGRIDNTPTLVKTVKTGQTLSFSKDQIVDWVYMERGRMTGNFTICVLLDETTEPKLSEVQKTFGVDCSWKS